MATGKTLRCGTAIPQDLIDGPLDLASLHTFLTRAEALGYDSAWVQEQIIGSVPILEPLTVLTYAAALTRTLRLGTSVMLTVLRNPIQLAKSLTSLDQLSQGRLTVGLGIGNQRPEDEAFGIPLERRARRFREGIEVMKALWTQPRATFGGDYWQFTGITQEPKPVQRPHPPLWFGAREPAALRRAVRLGDGWMGAGSSSTADFKAQAAAIRGFLDDAHRDPATFTLSKRVYIALDANKSRAEERLCTWFGIRYGRADMASRVAIWGGSAECLDRLAELVEAGAEHLLLNSAFDHLEHLEAFATELMPHLAGTVKA
jgi:probable F420-dependent oxidoreductase